MISREVDECEPLPMKRSMDDSEVHIRVNRTESGLPGSQDPLVAAAPKGLACV